MQLNLLKQILQEKCNLIQDRSIVIGVSGGADSLTLLSILSKLGYRLIVAHFDHQLRKESGRDAVFVQEIAREYGFESILGTNDVGHFALENKKTIEEAARILRYQFLLNVAERYSAQAVAVAHNADDQVETIFMHLLRGSGINGLCGMKYWDNAIFSNQSIPVIRPLLGIWRKDVDAYCKENGISVVEDITNTDTRFTRNRIRHNLLPDLERESPHFKEQLFQTGEILKAENDLVSQLANRYLSSIELDNVGSEYSWNKEVFLAVPLAIQRRLIYRILARYQKNTDNINFNMVDQVLRFITNSSRSHTITPVVGLQIYMHRGIVYFLQTDHEEYELKYPECEPVLIEELKGTYRLKSKWQLSVEKIDRNFLLDFSNISEYECWMDAEKVLLPLELRPAQPGDRIKLMGMSGHSKKIYDYLTDRHIPAQYRRTWPVLYDGGQVIWAAGSQPAEMVQVNSETKKLIHLLIRKVDE